MNRWTKMVMLGTVIAGATVSTIGLAGYRSTDPVYVSYSSGYAYGGMGDARSGAGYQYIGCDVSNGDSGYWTECTARDASGNNLWCMTHDPTIAAIAIGISSDAWIFFSTVSPGSSECGGIMVDHNSYYSPKQP